MNTRTIGTALAVTAAAAGMLTAFRRGFSAGLAAGYSYGDTDGYRRGLANGKPDALAQADEARDFAVIVAAIPDAFDSKAFADAVRMDAVRRSVQGREEMS